MSDDIQLLIRLPHELAQNWGWFLAFGIGVLVLGVAAVARTFAATVASMLFFGWLLVLGSGIEIAQAIMVGHWAGFIQHLLAAILFGVAGFMMVAKPLRSAEVMTAFMALFFLVGGLFRVIVALALTLPGWGWQVADGAIAFALGALLLAQWPISGLWAIGLFLGIDLIFDGCAWIAIALGLRSM